MTYTTLDQDIFLSYRHIDNLPLSGESQGWISRLHYDLERRVAQYLGSAVEMWRDCRLQGNEYFTESIEEKLNQVASMVSVLSPGYQASEWCQRELRGFVKAAGASGGIAIGNYSRLFKVIKTPTRLEEQPEELRGLLGYEFHHEGREFHLDPGPGSEKRYLAKLDDLARDLHMLLKRLRQFREGSLDQVADSVSKMVFLAVTTSDLNDSRDVIRRELQDRGYRVAPDESLPWNAPDLVKKVEEDLQTSCLSLHLIGSRYGVVPEGDTRSVIWLQHEMAAKRKAQGNFEQLLWMPPGLEALEPQQQSFLNYLDQHLQSQNGFEFMRTPLEALKSFLIEKLTGPTSPSPQLRPKGRLLIYLICERRDFSLVEPIARYLREQGHAVELPLQEGDPEEMSQDHRETLQDCDAILIYFGNGSPGWIREKVRDCRRAQSLHREEPFLAQGIYIGLEPSPFKQTYSNDEFIVSRNFGEFSPPALQAFLETLGRGRVVSA